MEEDKQTLLKKITVIIACVVLVALITYLTLPKRIGVGTINENESVWLKCSNSACNSEYQIGKKPYFEFIQENASPRMMRPPMLCKECNQKTVYRAVKCDKCGLIFYYGTSKDFMDRCPKCKYSKIEDSGK